MTDWSVLAEGAQRQASDLRRTADRLSGLGAVLEGRTYRAARGDGDRPPAGQRDLRQ
jgi:hypothetical protein